VWVEQGLAAGSAELVIEFVSSEALGVHEHLCLKRHQEVQLVVVLLPRDLLLVEKQHYWVHGLNFGKFVLQLCVKLKILLWLVYYRCGLIDLILRGVIYIRTINILLIF